MDRLTIGAAMAFVGMLVFVSSGSVGDANMINEALNALLVDNHPFSTVARVGFGMLTLGSLIMASWILFPGEQSENSQDENS